MADGLLSLHISILRVGIKRVELDIGNLEPTKAQKVHSENLLSFEGGCALVQAPGKVVKAYSLDIFKPMTQSCAICSE